MWAHLGYLQTNGTTLHLRVESGACLIMSMIDLNYGKIDDYFFKCMLNRWIIENDYGYCYCFPTDHWHLMLADFFMIN